MNILIDYDNIEEPDKIKGAKYVIERAILAANTAFSTPVSRINARLYGGWYEAHRPTRRCQSVSADIQNAFPSVMSVQGGARIQVSAELAYSIASEPKKHLQYTFRPRGYPRGLVCNAPIAVGCHTPSCPVNLLAQFINHKRCPMPGCQTNVDKVIYRPEQKLVDIMIAADIMHYAILGDKEVAVVSSDDDLWPAMRLAMLKGVRVIQIHTKPNWKTRKAYCGHTSAAEFSQGAL